MDGSSISRREFLKLAGAAGAVLGLGLGLGGLAGCGGDNHHDHGRRRRDYHGGRCNHDGRRYRYHGCVRGVATCSSWE